MDEEILRVLNSIKQLLSGAIAGSGDKLKPAGSAPTPNIDKVNQPWNQAMRANASSLNALSDQQVSLAKSFKDLNIDVGIASTNFAGLDRRMGRFIESLQAVKPPEETTDAQPATLPWMEGLQTSAEGVTDGFSAMIVQITNLNKAFGAFDATPLTTFNARLTEANKMPRVDEQAVNMMTTIRSTVAGNGPGKGPNAPAGFGNITPRTRPEDVDVPLKPILARMAENFSKSITAGGSLSVMFGALEKVTEKLVTDFMSLARIGLGSTSNLFDMSINAVKAGMSLEQYTQVLKESTAVASRVGSIDEYEKITSAANAQLATLGVFGSESKALQASLANSNAEMGLSADQIVDANAAQIGVFDKLRKTVNITASEFQNLIKSIASTDSVQKELLGVAPQNRAARMQEIVQIGTTAERLGLTGAAADKLTQALLAQRGATVKDRFEGAARLQQAAAFVGMGDEGIQAADIARKGRRASPEETEFLRDFTARLDKAQQGAYETGSFSAQNVIDEQSAGLAGTSVGKLQEASRPATLANEGGPAGQNADFGKHVGSFGQAVGQFGTLLAGFQSSVAPALITAIAAGLSIVFRKNILGVIGKIGGIGTRGAAAGGTTVAATAEAAAADAAKAAKAITETGLPEIQYAANEAGLEAQSLQQAGKEAKAAMSATAAETAEGVQTVTRAAGAAEGGLLEGALGFGKGLLNIGNIAKGFFGPLTGVFAAGMELFTGEVSTALNPKGGWIERIGGMATAFFSAIPNMLIDVVKYFFGSDQGGGPITQAVNDLQNGFDQFVTIIVGSVKFLIAKILNGASDLLQSLPLVKNSQFAKDVKGIAQSATDSETATWDTFSQLAADHSKTLSSISKENQKAADGQGKTANDATKKAAAAQAQFNNVAQAGQIQAGQMMADAKTIIGAPTVQTPAAIAPDAVNNPTTPAEQAKAQAAAATAQTGANADMMTVLNQILATMQASLTSEQLQAANSTEMLARIARTGASFPSAEQQANLLVKRT